MNRFFYLLFIPSRFLFKTRAIIILEATIITYAAIKKINLLCKIKHQSHADTHTHRPDKSSNVQPENNFLSNVFSSRVLVRIREREIYVFDAVIPYPGEPKQFKLFPT